MTDTILLYGATGYSGRLIAAEAANPQTSGAPGLPDFRMILAGRDGREVSRLAGEYGMEARVFGLEDRQAVIDRLHDVQVVINAAGPFALTANHLAKAALAANCHYVDINGEAEVYMKLDDLGRHAEHRGVAMVSGAGHTAAASDLLLHAALTRLGSEGAPGTDRQQLRQLGAVRIAVSRVVTLSRGSLETVWRSLREQVRVVRDGKIEDPPGTETDGTVIWHEPAGKLERAFNFFDPDDPVQVRERELGRSRARRGSDSRIAAAANLVDTLTARLTLDRFGFAPDRIESYLEAGEIARLGSQLGALLAPLAALPWTRDFARLQLATLPAGPTPAERKNETGLVVLEIEDQFQTRIVEWAWHTPNPYEFTAQAVIQLARKVAAAGPGGWQTPSAVLKPSAAALTADDGFLRGCRLHKRIPVAAEVAS